VVGGVLSSIPLLNAFNCCFCLLNLVGAGFGVGSYLRSHPNEKISNGDAAVCGMISGAITGLMTSVFGFLASLAFGPLLFTALSGVYRTLPPHVARELLRFTAGSASTLLMTPVNMAIYGGFGALGGFLSLHMLWKDRVAP
jgi:hypothetical protein